MTDLLTAILSSTCLCGLSLIIVKMCAQRKAAAVEYLLITPEHYEALKTKAEKKICVEQPLPDYTERDLLLSPTLQPPPL